MFLKAFCVVLLAALVAGNGDNPVPNSNPGAPQGDGFGSSISALTNDFLKTYSDGMRIVKNTIQVPLEGAMRMADSVRSEAQGMGQNVVKKFGGN